MNPAAQPSMAEALNRMWTKFLPQMEERVAALEAAAAALANSQLSPEHGIEAAGAAHKLAGVLGTFGLSKGTALARELEGLYGSETGLDPTHAAQLVALAAELRMIVENRR